MQWIEITIHTNTNGADAMADVFFSLGIAGVSIEDAADIALYQRESNDWDYIDESIFANRGGDVRVKARPRHPGSRAPKGRGRGQYPRL